ncbi:putative O-linked N-acetylglucosamine transferase, SPINDLY family [Bacteroidales bacterium Barb4]|nr:putative O-linked N-acetylglucosamine transferase, SPINDLY family [Bacteroidales bacterium Barb4]
MSGISLGRRRYHCVMLLSFFFLAVGAYGQTYQEWVERSFDCLDRQHLDSAAVCLQAAMQVEPGNPNNFALLTNLGTIQRQSGKTAEALISYTAALSRYPENIDLMENRASLYAEMNEPEKAIADYSTMLVHNPHHQPALYARGMLYLQQKNFILAEADFDKLLEVNDKTANGRIGYALLEKMRGNYDDSERIYNFLIDKFPRDWRLYEGRADLYFRMGKNARAMADINKLFAEMEQPSAALYVLRGKVKLALHEKASAGEDFRKALEMGYDAEIITFLTTETQRTRR